MVEGFASSPHAAVSQGLITAARKVKREMGIVSVDVSLVSRCLLCEHPYLFDDKTACTSATRFSQNVRASDVP